MNEKGKLFIYPLHMGSITSFEKSLLTLRQNFGIKIQVPCVAWAVLGGEKTILVDTGPSDEDWAVKYHWPLERSQSQEVEPALRNIGLSIADVDIVILTHLHWDHSYGVDNFPEANVLVQKSELEYAVAPLSADRRMYEVDIPGTEPPWMKVIGRITPVDGDSEIIPGVRVMHLPGHTPGSQSVVVDTSEGPWVIAGDTVPLFDNLVDEKMLEIAPSALLQSLRDFYQSLEKLKCFYDRILPSHDFRVLESARYPAL